VSRPVAPSLGFLAHSSNIGLVRNWGDELAVDAHVVQWSALALSLGFTLSRNQNRIESMGGQPRFISERTVFGRGFPIGAYFGRRLLSAELDTAGNPINVMCDGGPANQSRPVACAIAPDVYLGQPVPKWEGALRASATMFTNLRLYALADFKSGHAANDGDATAALQPGDQTSARASALANDPMLQACNVVIPSLPSTAPNFCRGRRKAGFAKLREVSASYTLPEGWTRGMHASRASITVSARNLAILWMEQREIFGFKILDPETRQGDETSELSNLVRWVIPQTTQVVTTLRVTFDRIFERSQLVSKLPRSAQLFGRSSPQPRSAATNCSTWTYPRVPVERTR
jgi:hypothetical protein